MKSVVLEKHELDYPDIPVVEAVYANKDLTNSYLHEKVYDI